MDDSLSRCGALSIIEEGHHSAGFITTTIVHWATPPLCKDGVSWADICQLLNQVNHISEGVSMVVDRWRSNRNKFDQLEPDLPEGNPGHDSIGSVERTICIPCLANLEKALSA